MPYIADEWFPESLYSTWLSDSLILMTSSLLFYHMVQKKSLVIDYRLAGLFAVILVFCSIGIGIVGLVPYYQRMGEIFKTQDKLEQTKKEKIYRIMFTIFGSIVIWVQFMIALFIIKGVANHK